MANKKKATPKVTPKDPERIEIDFNRIMRNKWREPYRTAKGEVARLGKFAVDGLDAQGGQGVDAVTKRRLDQLAHAIINPDFNHVWAAPFCVLSLPKRVADRIDEAINEGFSTGVYAEAHRLIFAMWGAVKSEEFEGIEIINTPSADQIETDEGVVADFVDDEPEEDDAWDLESENVPTAATEEPETP